MSSNFLFWCLTVPTKPNLAMVAALFMYGTACFPAQAIEVLNPASEKTKSSDQPDQNRFRQVGERAEDRANRQGRFELVTHGQPPVLGKATVDVFKQPQPDSKLQDARIPTSGAGAIQPKVPSTPVAAPAPDVRLVDKPAAAASPHKPPNKELQKVAQTDNLTTVAMATELGHSQQPQTAMIGVRADGNSRLVNSSDALLKEANQRARASLAQFLEVGANPNAGGSAFWIKIALTSGSSTEHIWVGALRPEGNSPGKVKGKLANDPQHLSGYKTGNEVTFNLSEVSDWMYVGADGTVRGNYTGCAIAVAEGQSASAVTLGSVKLNCSWLIEKAATAP